MIVFDLCCETGHRFEGWFGSSGDFASQQERGLLACPQCGSGEITKAPMAPAVHRKGNQKAEGSSPGNSRAMMGGSPPPEVLEAMKKLAEMQAEALKSSKWVGEKFAEESRAIHYGEREAATIHGKASPREARELLDEGIAVAPLPFPVSPPDELN